MPLYPQTKETARMQHSPSAWLSFSAAAILAQNGSTFACRSIEGLLFFPGSCRTVQGGLGTFTMAKGLAAR